MGLEAIHPKHPTAAPDRRGGAPLVLAFALALTACAKETDRPDRRRQAAEKATSPPGAAPARGQDKLALPATRTAVKASAGPESARTARPRKQPAEHPFGTLRVVTGGRTSDPTVRRYGVNPTIDTDEDPVSTFAVDVGTASYTLAAAALEKGRLPPESAVRVEEFLNAFDYGYAPPGAGAGAPFAIHGAVVPSPHRRGYHVLHLGLKARTLPTHPRPPATLVFVLDLAGGQGGPARLALVQRALRLLVSRLGPDDRLALVTLEREARVALPLTAGRERARILKAIDGLRVGPAADAQAGIRLGYQLARERRRPGGAPQVILCSDGLANAGVTSADSILQEIQGPSSQGITLTAVGVGLGTYRDVLLQTLARRARGRLRYVDRLAEAVQVFTETLTGAPQTVAADMKIQVAFDPRVVARYRLLGYERHRLEARDLADDRRAGGPFGAGQAVTALYEVRLRADRGAKPLGELRVRYRLLTERRSRQLRHALPASPPGAATAPPPAAGLALVVATFAEKLRSSYWVRAVRYEALLAQLDALPAPLGARAEVKRLRRLIEAARRLDRRGDRFSRLVPADRMSFDRVPVLR